MSVFMPEFPAPTINLDKTSPSALCTQDPELRYLGSLTVATYHLHFSQASKSRTPASYYEDLVSAAGVTPESYSNEDRAWRRGMMDVAETALRAGYLARESGTHKLGMTPSGRRLVPLAATLAYHWLSTDLQENILPQPVTKHVRNGHGLAVIQAALEPGTRAELIAYTGLTPKQFDIQQMRLTERGILVAGPSRPPLPGRTYEVAESLKPSAISVLRHIHSLASRGYYGAVGDFSRELTGSPAFAHMARLTMLTS